MKMSPLLRLAIPVAFANLGIMAMGSVDLLAVGRLGADATAAVGLGVSVTSWFLVIGIGLLSGIDYFASQAIGAGDPRRALVTWAEAVVLSVFLGIVGVVLPSLIGWGLEDFGIPSEVARQCRPFLIPMGLSLLPAWIFQCSRQVLQAFGKTRAVVVTLLAANVLNAAGNIIFVAGVVGFTSYGSWASGWVTLGSRVFTAVLVTWALARFVKNREGGAYRLRDAFAGVSRAGLKRYLRVGLPAAFQMGFEVGIFSLSTLLASRLGAVPGAAHQVALNLASLTFMVPLGIGSAGSVLVGRALGAKDFRSLRRDGWNAVSASSIFMGASCVVFLAVPEFFVGLFSTDPAVLSVGTQVLRVAGVFQLFDGLQVTLTGVLRGLGNTRDSASANFFGHWLIGLPVALGLSLRWGLVGIWIGLAAGLGVVALILLGRWVQALKQAVK